MESSRFKDARCSVELGALGSCASIEEAIVQALRSRAGAAPSLWHLSTPPTPAVNGLVELYVLPPSGAERGRAEAEAGLIELESLVLITPHRHQAHDARQPSGSSPAAATANNSTSR